MTPSRVIIPFAFFFLLLGVVTGIFRFMTISGVHPLSPALTSLYSAHGELMVFGFLATLIIAERYFAAVSLPHTPRVIHLMPLLIVVGILLKLATSVGAADQSTAILRLIGGVFFTAGVVLYGYFTAKVFIRGSPRFTVVFMILAAVLLFIAGVVSILRLRVDFVGLALVMLSFPLLTILGERIELSRVFTAGGVSRTATLAGVLGIVGAATLTAFTLMKASSWILVVPAAAYLAMVAVFLKIERFSAGGGGLQTSRLNSYVRVHTKFAYGWLMASFVLLVAYAVLRGAALPGVFLFDAALHALALGFVGGMILAHGPVILPSLLNRPLNDVRLSFIPLALLTSSVALRVAGGVSQEAGFLQPYVLTLSGLLILPALLSFFVMIRRATSGPRVVQSPSRVFTMEPSRLPS